MANRPAQNDKEGQRHGGQFGCLTYHVIGNVRSQYAVSESQFDAQLTILRSQEYTVEDFASLEARLRSRRGIPNRYVILTIDDGHESAMRAAEILALRGCHATFFVTRNRCVTRAHFIRGSAIRQLRRLGFSVGTHGTTHKKLTFMPEEACVDELNESKQWLEDVIGEEVRYMAAPGGYINARVVQLAYGSGYQLVGTCQEQMNSANSMSLPRTVNRVSIRQHYSLEAFRHAIEGHSGFYLWRQFRSAVLAVPKYVLAKASHEQIPCQGESK